MWLMKWFMIILVTIISGGCVSYKSDIVFQQEQFVHVEPLMETFLNIPLEMEKVGDDILISDF